MSTRVEFLISNRADALAVPHQAILNRDGTPHVAVQKPGGNIEIRAVSVGLYNDKLVEITQGIASGDDVILNPTALLSEKATSRLTPPSTSSGSSRTPPDRKP